MFGRTHIKDSETGEYLNLNALDVDCQIVYNRLNVPIHNLIDASSWDWVTDEARNLVKAFLSSAGVENGDYNQGLLNVFRKSTFVTRTRKEYGYHIYWLSRQQKNAVGTAACKPGYEFEIKTDNSLGLCTLPTSRHKEDPNFRYAAIGITGHLLANDILYDLFVEIFKDCIVDSKENVNESQEDGKQEQIQSKDESKKEEQAQQQLETQLNDLSPSAVKATAGYLSDFIVRGYRHSFYVYLTGMTFYYGISLKSAREIVTHLCDMTNDEEKKSRLETLKLTYEKGFIKREVGH